MDLSCEVLDSQSHRTIQCNGLTSNYSNSFSNLFLLFDVIFFVLFLRDKFDVFTIFSELSGLKRSRVLFMEIYIYMPMKSSILSLTKYAILCKKEEEKSHFLIAYRRSYFPKFSLVLSANMY